MSLYKHKLTTTDKPTVLHPWAATIKDKHSSNIKHVHNSINNPNFPKEKKKQLAKERTRFTVIGDRLHKDFIYCAKFVKDLHKYRAKYYDAPVIRGVTSVEWPEVKHHLKIKYGGHAFCLLTPLAVLINTNMLGGIQEFKALISHKYFDHLSLDYYREGVFNFASYLKASGRPCAFMHISIDDKHVGTLIFMLFADLVPYTCENFLRLCKETRGGYSGTPVHRIVKDGWIQCGGFGLKKSDLGCENFIIPFDRRGVLAMANNGRHNDCSTQFFILLQPSTWMTHKYVAFGQLIEGVNTLETIENVPTVYESPKSKIIIYSSGILNMECHDIMINKNANEYIFGHIEDLIALGETIYEWVMEEVSMEIDRRENPEEEEGNQNVRETQRFLRKKEEILSQYVNRPSAAISQVQETINNEFDVDEYAYEYVAEETSTKPDDSQEPSLIVKPEKPYYIPLTDVPYPGEVDSTFDLKKFLKGDYCLESDLEKPNKIKVRANKSYLSEMFRTDESISASETDESLDSDEERKISNYLKTYSDHVSFTGPVIRKIAKTYGMMHLADSPRVFLTDEDIRKIRLASLELKQAHETKVCIRSPSIGSEKHSKIKRRQTGFVRPHDLPFACRRMEPSSESLQNYGDDECDSISRKVRIVADSAQKDSNAKTIPPARRRPTGFERGRSLDDKPEFGTVRPRPSVLERLYHEMSSVAGDEPSPTLKEYSPVFTSARTNFLLTHSSNNRIMGENAEKEHYERHTSFNMESSSYDRVLAIKHNRKIVRKISSDYVKTIDQIEHSKELTMRTIEYAKTRPSLTVSEYQMKNLKYKEQKDMNE